MENHNFRSESGAQGAQQDPRAVIMGMLNQMHAEGAIDSEDHQMKKIIYDLNFNGLSSEEALKQAHEIAAKRQNYH